MQALSMHVIPVGHTFPQPSQLFESLVKFTQAVGLSLGQICVCGGQPHWPAAHTCVAGHAMPHIPQFEPSVWRSLHVSLPQTTSPGGHPHWPLSQVSVPGHALPHFPQFELSVPRSAHVDVAEQNVPLVQAHFDEMHVSAPLQVVPHAQDPNRHVVWPMQTFPQLPQSLDVVRSVHVPLHACPLVTPFEHA